jgi:hypothetical protein
LVSEPAKELESDKHQRYAITNQQFGTSLALYPYQSVARKGYWKKGCSKLLIGDCVLLFSSFQFVHTVYERAYLKIPPPDTRKITDATRGIAAFRFKAMVKSSAHIP